MPSNQRNTVIRFPDDRNFSDFRAFIAQNYRPTEATVRRDKVIMTHRGRPAATVAVLTTFDLARLDHEALASIAFNRHAGVLY